MAQGKLNDLAGKFGKGGPPGLGLGIKLLGAVGAAAYGVSQSMYTGKHSDWEFPLDLNTANYVKCDRFQHNLKSVSEMLHLNSHACMIRFHNSCALFPLH